MKLFLFLAIIAVLSPVSIHAQSLASFNAGIFLGSWEMHTSKGILLEEWTPLNPSSYLGKSYQIQHGDTTLQETVQLTIKHGLLLYIPVVNNQNEGKETVFTYNPAKSDSADHKFVFENFTHDFPQRIIYHWKDEKTLQARVEGMVKNKLEFSDYDFKKVVR